MILSLLLGPTLAFSAARADWFDPGDSPPSRWRLGSHDCRARMVRSTIDPDGGHDGRPCESIRLSAGHGSRLLLQYRLPPSRVIRELHGSVWLLAAREGARVGFRLHYPYLRDAATGQTVTTVVYGETYSRAGEWQQLRVGAIEAGMRARESALRIEHGAQANLRDAFVDALVLDVYNGPGTISVLVDDLRITQMVPVGSVDSPSGSSPDSGEAPSSFADSVDPAAARPPSRLAPPVFPRGKVTRIIEHNGESLEWLYRLGFDAVLLSRPADAEILREASQAGMRIYCPPPSSIQPEIEPLLEPLAAWYLGTSLDGSTWPATAAAAERVAAFPPLWQRPCFAAPVEKWSRFAAPLDGIVYDLPPTLIGLSGEEESHWLREQMGRARGRVEHAIGIQTSPPDSLVTQLAAISQGIGAPPQHAYPWHPIWLQTMRALERAPRAILFRSPQPLTSGEPADQRRALAMGYINRVLAAVGPLVAAGSPAAEVACHGADYRGGQLRIGNTRLLLLSTQAAATPMVLAGDGDVLEVELPRDAPVQFAWRLTHFSAERLEVQRAAGGASLQIVAPDLAEWIVISDDPSLGQRLGQALAAQAPAAASERWHLSSEGLMQVRDDWRAAAEGRLVATAQVPTSLLVAAANALSNGEPLYRGGDAAASLRLTKRADAWSLRAGWQWSRALLGDSSELLSFPPALATSTAGLQLTMLPQLAHDDRGWSRNRLTGGAFESASELHRTGWNYDRRIELMANSEIGIAEGVARSGQGCLRVEVTSNGEDLLPGGYAGTAVRVRSPVVHYSSQETVRIDAQIRTLGFGAPYQGVLVYDSVGGPELGVLVRNAERWQAVRLIRRTYGDTPVRVMFEVIGDGEALIDDVRISEWKPVPDQADRFRPISMKTVP